MSEDSFDAEGLPIGDQVAIAEAAFARLVHDFHRQGISLGAIGAGLAAGAEAFSAAIGKARDAHVAKWPKPRLVWDAHDGAPPAGFPDTLLRATARD